MTEISALASRIIDDFRHMVERDGGTLTLDAADDSEITLRYCRGGDPECADGACVLPGADIEQLIRETLARRAPGVRVVVKEFS